MTREDLNKILVEHHFQLISEHNNKRVTTYTYTCNISYLNRFIIFCQEDPTVQGGDELTFTLQRYHVFGSKQNFS